VAAAAFGALAGYGFAQAGRPTPLVVVSPGLTLVAFGLAAVSAGSGSAAGAGQ
jgi:hypothetical protein